MLSNCRSEDSNVRNTMNGRKLEIRYLYFQLAHSYSKRKWMKKEEKEKKIKLIDDIL